MSVTFGQSLAGSLLFLVLIQVKLVALRVGKEMPENHI